MSPGRKSVAGGARGGEVFGRLRVPHGRRGCSWALGATFALACTPATLGAQTAPPREQLPPVYKSLGQPWTLKPYAAGSFTWNREGADHPGGVGILGIYKDLVLPLSGAFGVSAEGYLGGVGSAGTEAGGWDGGARLFATSRLLFLNLGVDWNARTEQTDFILAFTPYFRRGGLFRTGGNFRIEWIPGRGNSFNFGFQVPLEPHMGKTRPVERDVHPPKARAPRRERLPEGAQEPMRHLRQAGRWLVLHANFFNDDDDASFFKAMERFRKAVTDAKALFAGKDDRHPEGHSYALEAGHYHEAFDAVFSAAVGAAEGRAVADRAREVLLDEVLLPYDRNVGRFKNPDTLRGLAGHGRAAFGRDLAGRAALSPAEREAALAVWDAIVDTFELGRTRIKDHWEGDERKVWMPLDLALRPEQHDTQEELDAIVARAVGRPFLPGTSTFPTNAARFQLELVRSIREARDYHVLWIHDYAGIVDGKPDPVALAVSTKGYLEALADRVREYDETGRLPAFFIFQTQFFYEGSKSRLYLSLLEDPLHHHLKLGRGHEDMEREVREAQENLRQAVASSKRLQAEALERGEGWLRKVVKVHVSVTFPADLSFRSRRVVDFLPFTPDTLTLDHRKLFFYDVTEDDPNRGEALFTGTGVGSEYAGPTWDDRGLLVSGPALLRLKTEARRLLRSQGFKETETPEPLRERPLPADYQAILDARVAAGHTGRALIVHNEVGFDQKDATLAQAILYTLAPADTLIVVPDSIWASPFWAGQLAGAALRGCHVHVIAPSLDNAPAAGAPILARTREVFARLLAVSHLMADEIDRAGGNLRVGLYTRAAPSGDTLGKIREAADGFRKYPFLQEEFPMPPGTTALFDEVAAELEAAGYKPHFIAEGTREGRPKMHRKTQLFGTRRALRVLASYPQAATSLRSQLTARAKATADPTAIFKQEDPLEVGRPLLDAITGKAPAGAENAVYYVTVGSKNQDPRSAFLDGETSFIVAGPYALAYYSDFIFLMGATTWVQDEAELTKLIPVEEEKARKMGRLIRKVI
jgi:phosphatidylserine/phosphatidylglycerophosphate/cardiolipin synthase-like enzyme